MGKLSSTIGALGKAAKGAAKRVSKSKVVKKTALAGKKAVRATRKGISGAKVGGSKFLQKSVSKIKPIASDLKQGGIRKINKIVESKAQNLIPKLSNKIEEKVNSFDPNKFLGKIFDGGLNSLNQFGSSLEGMRGKLGGSVEFIGKANELASKFVKKLASAKGKDKGGGGGIFGKLIKGVAIAGAAALALPTVAKVAVAGGAVAAGGALLKKGIDFIRGRKKKKLEKKQEEAKVKKDKGNAGIFKNILDKFSSILDFTPKRVKRFKSLGVQEKQSVTDTEKGIFTDDYRFKKFTDNDGDKKVHDLKISMDRGQITSGNDSPTTRRIVAAFDEHRDLKDDLNDLKRAHSNNPEDPEIAAKMKDLRGRIKALQDEINELIPIAEGTTTMEGTRENVEKVMNDPNFAEEAKDGKDGKDGKSKPGQIFNNIKNTIGGLKEKAGNFLGGVKKALTPKKGGGGGRKKKGINTVKPGEANKDPISFANDNIAQAEAIKPDTKKKDATTQVAGDISKPAKGGGSSSGGGGGGGDNIIPLEIPASGGGKKGAPAKKPSDVMDREFVKPQNQIPSLLAIDTANMHILHAKSVFNIVDAL
jgi:hypothetical protein